MMEITDEVLVVGGDLIILKAGDDVVGRTLEFRMLHSSVC